MAPLPFNLGFLQFLADHRTPFLTRFFLAVSALGNVGGYILIATLVYVAWNKRLAIRLTTLLLLTTALNDLLKIVIKNPRPFMREGSYRQKWAVSPESADSLAAQYSTPSGHAMSSSAFYSYLFRFLRSPWARALAIAAFVLIGFSRPYLGVHYGEDILLGWAFGLGTALLAARYGDAIAAVWNRLAHAWQIAGVVASSAAVWLIAVALDGGRIAGQSRELLPTAGFLAGVVVAHPLELRLVNFDPQSSTVVKKFLRYLLSIAVTGLTLFLSGKIFAMLADRASLIGNLLEYLRYAATGFAIIFLAPLLFTKLGLAERAPAEIH